MTTNRLLVIDWDYFFYNPLEAGDRTPDCLLYDWGCQDNALFRDLLWGIRRDGFLKHNIPLPHVSGWEKFSKRFSFDPGATLFHADSNLYAACLPRTDYSEVWLYDAHHDCGYGRERSLMDFIRRGSVSCENWMLAYLALGATLRYRSPPWHTRYKNGAPKVPDGVTLDHQVDDLATVPGSFSDVFVCRSGPWVPPWCDDAYRRFLRAFKLPRKIMGGVYGMKRDVVNFDLGPLVWCEGLASELLLPQGKNLQERSPLSWSENTI